MVSIETSQVDDLAAVAADVDVLYQTRIQKERFTDLEVRLL
jgi:aspartate carbamoyltransferase catalytic subunit